jgi:hypothetical protein
MQPEDDAMDILYRLQELNISVDALRVSPLTFQFKFNPETPYMVVSIP